MADKMLTILCVSFTFSILSAQGYNVEDFKTEDFDFVYSNGQKIGQNICTPFPIGGTQWILSIRNQDYGWKAETHRAVIALAVNQWPSSTPEEIKQMKLQLEVEITKALLRNDSIPIHPNDLALFINALVSTQHNPHNFYGIDLVSYLRHLVDNHSNEVHPFLLLALCNSRATTNRDHYIAEGILRRAQYGSGNSEQKALALLAYECGASLAFESKRALINEVRTGLIAQQQDDGSFGNVYTTALIVQALSVRSIENWDRKSALEYLRSQSTVDVNMVSAYLIELALNADKVPFIKNLFPTTDVGPAVDHITRDRHFVSYTIRVGLQPDVYFTISMSIAPNSSFFDIMKKSAEYDQKFNFSYYIDTDKQPKVYSISGLPNDAEENMYWHLCLQSDIDHDRHRSTLTTIFGSPAFLFPKNHEHIIYWYKDRQCEESN